MQKVTFTSSRGITVELANRAPFILSEIDGLGDVQAEVQRQKAPFQDGSTFIDSTLTERFPILEVSIIAKDTSDLLAKRALLSSIFNPKLGEGTLRYENNGVVREIKAAAEHVPVFPSGQENRGMVYQRVMISLICHDPYWLDTHIESEPMSAWLGGMKFPLRFPTAFAMKSTAQIFLNDGDVPAPVEITFHGPATNPVVTNTTTGEFVRVNRTLGANDKLIVNTSFGNKSVQIEDEAWNRTNVFNWIDLDSTFWQLDVGYNEIEYSADSGTENATVQIIWRKRYVGV